MAPHQSGFHDDAVFLKIWKKGEGIPSGISQERECLALIFLPFWLRKVAGLAHLISCHFHPDSGSIVEKLGNRVYRTDPRLVRPSFEIIVGYNHPPTLFFLLNQIKKKKILLLSSAGSRHVVASAHFALGDVFFLCSPSRFNQKIALCWIQSKIRLFHHFLS